jgi:hypothetical protein
MSAQRAGMDSLQIGNSRILHDTTTSFGQPYNIVTNAQLSGMAAYDAFGSLNVSQAADLPDKAMKQR